MTDLAQRSHNPPAPTDPGFAIPGLEGIGNADVILPRWVVVQPTSQFDGSDDHVGQFRRNVDGAFAKTLDVVFLNIHPNRLLWSGDLTERRPECLSRDARVGSLPRTPEGEYGTCHDCCYNPQFNRQLAADRAANVTGLKVCSYGYNGLCVDDVQTGSMSLFGVMGTSVRPFKTLLTQFVQRKKSPFSALVTLATSREQNDRGKYYVVAPSISRWFTPEESEPFRQLFLESRGRTFTDAPEETDTADAPDF